MDRRIVFACLSSVSLATATFAQGRNWPSFRGPNGSGLGSGEPPTTWNVETGENVRWKVALPGLAHSSPIVWGDRVFVTTAVSEAGDPRIETGWMNGSGDSAEDTGEWRWAVLCLDRDTGRVLWEQTAHRGVPRFKRHPKATHANSTPATDGRHVVAFFGAEGLHTYDFEGKLLWTLDLGPLNAAAQGYPDLQWGFASSPILHEGQVIVQCDVNGPSFWAAYDVATGKEIRKVERQDYPGWCTPAIRKTQQQTQLILNGYKHMGAYDLATGKELWRLSDGGDVPVPVPIIAGDLVVITNGHGRRPIYAVRADASGDLTPTEERTPEGLAWWRPNKGSYMPTPLVLDDILYVGDDNGVLTAFDVRTGETHFRQRLPAGGRSTYSASPVAAGGRIYLTSEDGQIDVVKAGRSFEVLASNQMGESCMATPAISDGCLFVRGRKHLFCLAAARPTP